VETEKMSDRLSEGGTAHGRSWPLLLLLFLAAAGFVAVAACSSPRKADQQPPPTVRRVDEAGIIQAVQKQRGRVVLLDIWATWCSPCVEEFPYLAKWQDKYGRENLAIVAVSLDMEDDLPSKVIPFLRGQRTEGIDLLLYVGGNHDKMVNTIDPKWTGEAPALFLYDRSGRLRHSLSGEYKPAEVEDLIEKLLASPER
jgi:thiol-disulfide isomerase/thioredoxin